MAVGDGAHNAAHGQTVEVVVDEDQHAQSEGCHLCAGAGLHMLLSPAAKSSGTAGSVDQGHHDAQQNQEDQNTCVPAVAHIGDQAVVYNSVECADHIKVSVQQSAGQNADEQGAVNLLGDQSQHDGDDGRRQSHKGAVIVAVSGLGANTGAGAACADSGIYHAGAVAIAAL